MFKKILLVLAAIIAVFLIVVVLQPGDFWVERSTTIAAPPAVVFGQVNDFRNWTAWSPWENLDPELKRTYSDPAAGEGAQYSWVGNSSVGEGGMTITESRTNEHIGIRLDFLKPMKATNTAEFAFQPEGEATKVTWSMSGTKNFISKGMCMFMDMDKMLGGAFEEGLGKLKTVSENAAATTSTTAAAASSPTTAPAP